MAKNTVTITPELEAAALNVVASLDGPPAGFVPATPGQVTVGQVVSCWGHNKQRVGIVTEVTKTRVHVLFTTPGAIDEAQRITAQVNARPTDLAIYIAEARKTFTSNYLFYIEEANPRTAKYSSSDKAGYADRLAEIEEEGFEARLARQAQASLDDTIARKALTWQDRVGYTHSWKKISDVYVQEVTA